MVNMMDVVNGRHCEFTVTFGSLLTGDAEKRSFVISSAWRPRGGMWMCGERLY